MVTVQQPQQLELITNEDITPRHVPPDWGRNIIYQRPNQAKYRRPPTIDDLTELLTTIQGASPSGIEITSFGMALARRDNLNERIANLYSLSMLESYLELLPDKDNLDFYPILPNAEIMHFTVPSVCKGTLCYDRSPDSRMSELGILNYAFAGVIGFGTFVFSGMFSEELHRWWIWPAATAVALAASIELVAHGYVHTTNAEIPGLYVGLWYGGPNDTKSEEYRQYCRIARTLANTSQI